MSILGYIESRSLSCLQMQSKNLTGWLRIWCIVAIAAAAALSAAGQPSVLTQHNDIGRTGQNTAETLLNTSNVNVNSFGLLFSLPVTGQVYAQPLYVPNVTINGGSHNVLIVATEQDNVYAFDADSGTQLWSVSLVDSNHGASPTDPETAVPSSSLGCTDLQPYVGVTSTPVIDPVAGTIYVEAKSTDGTNYIHRLHALSLTTGAEKSPGPVVITATVSGTGDGSNNGQLTFNGFYQHARPGLLLLNELYGNEEIPTIFVAFASHCDNSPYHGWLFAYRASDFTQQSVLVTTPNGGLGGFWMAGSGVAADANNNIYIASGNGDFDTTNVPATELGDTIMKLTTTGGQLSLNDYFTPSDQQCLASDDTDLGSGGVLVLPDQTGATNPHILVEAGKEGAIYVVNRDNPMTAGNNHFENSNNCTTNDPQILEESASGAIGGMWSMPAYWNGTLYFWGSGDVLRSIPLVSGLPSFSQTTNNSTSIGFPGATPSISSNGTTAGSAILWAIDSSQYGSPGPGPGPAILYAFDATNINDELWDSTQASNNRDTAGNAVKFAVPTVVNGKVYVGATNIVDVYGLFNPAAALTSPASGSTLSGANVTFSWSTATGATLYELYLGSNGKGSSNLYISGQLSPSTTQVNVTGLPTIGATIYARMWTKINGTWVFTDTTYTESGSPSKASMNTPTPGTQLPGANVTFTWNLGQGPSLYELYLGSTGAGSSNLYISGQLNNTTTSVNVTGLPTYGETVYARLWSKINGTWEFTDYTYTETGSPSQASMNTPTPGTQLPGANVTFTWNLGQGPSLYELYLGSTGAGSSNLYISGQLSPSTTSVNVTGLPTDGRTINARLWSKINGTWEYSDYTYTAQ